MSVKVRELTVTERKIVGHFAFLYGREAAYECLDRLKKLFSNYGYVLEDRSDEQNTWDETDALLIAYGDSIQSEKPSEKHSLQLLEAFLSEHLKDAISTLHILPIFPSSSDAGYSVKNYKKVREDLGNWSDIERLASEYRLMVDLVINHVSRFSEWFNNYQKGESPGRDFFIEVDPHEDLSETTRPRSSSLLTSVQTIHGLRHVWTTFSDDQIDLDFSNPEVLFAFIDIFLFYYSKGARVFRFDAVAYLWKRIGTKSIHLKETHEIVKLFRNIAGCIDADISIITETNVPFDQNFSYFSEGEEAQMIYQFSLPPLLLHAILTENAAYLTQWAAALPEPPEGCTYLNFTASHDGIGVRPLEGLIPQDEFDYLVKSTEARGGFITYKENPGDGQSPYELNITYFDAFEEPGHPQGELQIKRFWCSQLIMLSLKGVPGIYFQSLMAARNNLDEVLESGNKRDINRKIWRPEEAARHIEETDGESYCALSNYVKLLKIRKKHPAFHPSGSQRVLQVDERIFAFVRTAPDRKEQIAVISNLSSSEIYLPPEDLRKAALSSSGKEDIITGRKIMGDEGLRLNAFQTVWLVL